MTRRNPIGLSLRDLEYALAVAELGHFGRAAERCGVSQPGLSDQVRKLEQGLGTRLFERGRGGVNACPAAEPLLKQMAVVVREARTLMQMAHSQAGALNGRLDLGVIPTLGPYYVPLVLRELRQHHPRLVLRLQEARTADLLDALTRFNLDAALVALPVEAEGVRQRPLFFEPFHLLLPEDHALSRLDRVPVSALSGHELLLLEEGHCLRDQSVSLCRPPDKVRTEEPRFATSLEMLRHMVAAGEGVCLMPALATGDSAALNGLVRLRPLDAPRAGRTVGLVWRATDPRGSDFEQLADLLRDTAPDGMRDVPPA